MKKKVLGVMLAAVMCVSTSLIAFAVELSWEEAPGYGELWGWLEAIKDREYYVMTAAAVDVNTDNAFLRTNIEMLALDGSSVYADSAESIRGETSFTHNFYVNNFQGVSTVFCSHEVVGGSKYPAAVVYTCTSELPD